jgi:branched-chain amino acid transport system ATP-binding protein
MGMNEDLPLKAELKRRGKKIMGEVLLEIRDLNKSFKGLRAANSVNLKIEKGGCHSIIGPNGAGKTTLFNLISGYFPADSGKLIFQNREITGLSTEAICKLGIARSFQLISIFPRLTAYEGILMSLLAREGKSLNMFSRARHFYRKETLEILGSVGLINYAEALSGDLSIGDQKRLEFGMAISQHPKLLLLDEPTAGMSPVEKSATMELLQKLMEERGITVLLTEHDVSLVLSISKWIGVLHFGTLVAAGSPESIKGNEMVRRIYLGEEM